MFKKIFMCLIVFIFSNQILAKSISIEQYNILFKNYNGCFILYDVSSKKMLALYNPNNRCKERIPSDSTFKIAISLMAFNQGIITESTIFKDTWEYRTSFPEWNHDQTPATWIKYSVVPISQQLTPQIGLKRIQRYLKAFEYGNQDFSGDKGKNNGLTHAWLSSSLKISAFEQLNFINAMISNELPVNDYSVKMTMKNMYQGQLLNGMDYYGKTGSGWRNREEGSNNLGKIRDGWFVGFIIANNHKFIFVANISDKKIPPYSERLLGGAVIQPLTIKLLNDYFKQ